MRKKRAGPSTKSSLRESKSRRAAPPVPKVRESATFTYSPLADGCIRVIQIDGLDSNNDLHCTLRHIILDDAAKYEAISYAWNNEILSVPIECNGKQLFITPSLHEALLSWHVTGDGRLLWADAVCINQSDDIEKAIQVQMMGTIYSKAIMVIVWLGPRSIGSDMAMESFGWLNNRLKKVGEKVVKQTQELAEVMELHGLEGLGIPHDDPIWQRIAELLDRSWFKRLWTMQEFCLARYCIFLCGSRVAGWDDLVSLIMTISYHNLIFLIQPAVFNSGTAFAILHQDGIRNDIRQGILPTLDELMQYARTRKTSNPLDKVYAVLGLVDPELGKKIKIDYSNESRENYWRVYVALGHLLLAGSPSLYLLSHASSKERPSVLPSWCPNFDSIQEVQSFERAQHLAGGIVTQTDQLPHVASSLDGRSIMLRGAQIDNVSGIGESSWQWFGGSHQEEVYRSRLAFLTECLRMSRKLLGEPSDITLGTIDKMPEILMRTLVGNYLLREKIYAPSKEVLGKMFHSLQKLVYRVCELVNSDDWSMSKDEVNETFSCLEAINVVCVGRRLFTTCNGRLGMGPPRIQPGDIVCIFRGVPLPLILRPEPTSPGDEEIFKLVGEAYVHGVMEGEIFQAEDEGERVPERLFTVA